ncbi:37 kDa salivary gland allergen Aed a 2-like [Anopheles coustani]|uniref:37 kDa salivary gland allergen Aed a 2-like n=1 Tax=Anopheles coustani TaxID=139045 RepID=UPI00265861D8|nr:37 kDa salivary gland allergen Aed a 2-like [Anopheles coustani]
MIGIVILCALFIAHGANAQGQWKALNPEQALFIYTRCQEDNLPSGPSRAEYITNWHQFKLEPNDAITQCYTKCALEGLGVYDGKDKEFRSNRIITQHEAYRSIIGANDDEVAQFKQAVSELNAGSGSCADVYNAYLPVHNRFVGVIRQLYHGTVEGVAKIYAADPSIKKKGESYFAYCEKRVYGDSNKDDLCKARQYELTGSAQLKDSIDCIFRGLRYMNENGINVDEIVRDFKLVNKGDLEGNVKLTLLKCRGGRAYDYYTCLVNSEMKEDFKKAFDFREVRSANYAYLVQGKVYDPASVAAEVAKADATVC